MLPLLEQYAIQPLLLTVPGRYQCPTNSISVILGDFTGCELIPETGRVSVIRHCHCFAVAYTEVKLVQESLDWWTIRLRPTRLRLCAS